MYTWPLELISHSQYFNVNQENFTVLFTSTCVYVHVCILKEYS